ncbi:MAG: PRD domain-containing protein [Coprobacillaceae bacterium]
MENRYIVTRLLNNNIVQCFDTTLKRDCILLGNGIGFGKKKHDVIELENIEKSFVMEDQKNLTKYQQLVVSCDPEIVDVTEKIIVYLEEEFKTTYNEYLHIALLDHLNFSVYRYRNNIEVPNIFLEELAMMYQKEYQFSETMLSYVNKTLGITLPKSEISFITMHIHAALKNKKVSKASLYAAIIKDCLEYI